MAIVYNILAHCIMQSVYCICSVRTVHNVCRQTIQTVTYKFTHIVANIVYSIYNSTTLPHPTHLV
jgi:hypothetical protein